jgi:predicted nucleic acid-binding protein
VIDASVVLKWYLPDEEYGQKSVSLLEKYIANELDFHAPSLLEYEIINGLIVARKRGRVAEQTVVSAIDGFFSLEMKLHDLSGLYPKIIHYCNAYNLSAYDTSYLVLAEEQGVPMITADERLYNTVKKNLKWVKWLGEYFGEYFGQ